MDIERIELPNGQWAEIKTVVSRRMRKAFRKAGIASVMGGGSNGAGPLDLSDAEGIRAYIMAHPEKWDLNTVDDAFLLHGVIAWSWPEPITAEALDALPDAWVESVLIRLRALYTEATPETLKA